jgi:AraC-like DNA-binding protein
MDPPWAVRIEDEAPLEISVVVRGEAWVLPDDDETVRLTRGDVMIARGPGHYTVAGDPATPPAAVILPGQRCVTLEGEDLQGRWRLGVRTWGNAEDGQTLLITGAYHLSGEVSDRLLRVLPDLLVLRDHEWDSPVIPLLTQELVKDEPGQEAVLDRLLDLLLIAVLRAWFARPEAQTPAWYRAASDPVIGHALRLLHHNPAHPWTVAELARETGLSRAALARRFNDLVGEPPMSFLTSWRIALAADLLLEPSATVGSVAPQVGYSSPFALSTAFKRVRGMSPQQYRTHARSRGRGRGGALSASG